MWKWLLLGLGVILLAGGVAFFWMMQGPDLKKYETLNAPRISLKPDTPVLEVPFSAASADLPKVFGLLMKTYFKLSGVPKGPGMPAPAARYETLVDMNLPAEKRAELYNNILWKGSAAIPVPAALGSLPAETGTQTLHPRLSVWTYGEVAEILHHGSYEDEPPTVKKLTDYIASQGYEIAGLHEEEYLRGPGMPFSKPENYLTIIRYPVRKKDVPAVP